MEAVIGDQSDTAIYTKDAGVIATSLFVGEPIAPLCAPAGGVGLQVLDDGDRPIDDRNSGEEISHSTGLLDHPLSRASTELRRASSGVQLAPRL